jgi:succinate dehydrogenase (ubiquinone) cytochrome b560 subunit
VGVAGVSLLDSNRPAELAQSLGNSAVGPVAKFAVAFPLSYHFIGASRHAVWDLTGKGFTNALMMQSAYGVTGAATVLSLALAMYSLPPDKKKK